MSSIRTAAWLVDPPSARAGTVVKAAPRSRSCHQLRSEALAPRYRFSHRIYFAGATVRLAGETSIGQPRECARRASPTYDSHCAQAPGYVEVFDVGASTLSTVSLIAPNSWYRRDGGLSRAICCLCDSSDNTGLPPQIPAIMANPPSSAIANWNPPPKTGTYTYIYVPVISRYSERARGSWLWISVR